MTRIEIRSLVGTGPVARLSSAGKAGPMPLLDTAIIVAGKTVGWALVAWQPLGCRKLSPEELQQTAELESAWTEILIEARSRTPERADPDPHVLKLSRIPAP
jgi:hypothetical protein